MKTSIFNFFTFLFNIIWLLGIALSNIPFSLSRLQPSHVENKKKIEDEMALLQQTVKQCEDYKTELKGKLLNLQESLNNRNDALVDLQAQEKRLQKTLGKYELDFFLASLK